MACAVVGSAILAIYAIQIVLHQAGLVAVAAAGFAFGATFVGVLAWARRSGVGWRLKVGLRRPSLVHVVAGVLVGVSAWYVNLWIVTLIGPGGDAAELQKAVEQSPFVWTLLALGVLPALAEELVFRGVFARALVKRLGVVHAVGFSAAVFGLYHLLPAQIITTFCLGLVLAFLTLRASSVVPAMIAHFLNNLITLVIARREVPGLARMVENNPTMMLAGTALLLAGGMALAARGGAA